MIGTLARTLNIIGFEVRPLGGFYSQSLMYNWTLVLSAQTPIPNYILLVSEVVASPSVNLFLLGSKYNEVYRWICYTITSKFIKTSL